MAVTVPKETTVVSVTIVESVTSIEIVTITESVTTTETNRRNKQRIKYTITNKLEGNSFSQLSKLLTLNISCDIDL